MADRRGVRKTTRAAIEGFVMPVPTGTRANKGGGGIAPHRSRTRQTVAERAAEIPKIIAKMQAEPVEQGQHIWLQLPGESDKDYRLFGIFRDLGPARTLEEFCRVEGYAVAVEGSTRKGEIGRRMFPGHILEKRRQFYWMVRVKEFDEYTLKHRTEVLKAEEAMGVWEDRGKSLRNRTYDIGNFLMELVEDKALSAKGKRRRSDGVIEDLPPVEDRAILTVKDVASMATIAKSAVSLMQAAVSPTATPGRQAAANPWSSSPGKSGIQPSSVDETDDGKPLLPVDLSEASDEQMRDYLAAWTEQPQSGGSSPRTN